MKPDIKTIFKNYEDYENFILNSKDKVKSDQRIILETVNDTKIIARDNIFDIKIIKEQFVKRQYFPIDVFDLNYKPHTVLDVGGYIGDFALYCSGELNSIVYCYEPTPQNFSVLAENLKLNPKLDNKIKIFNKAVSNSESEILLNVHDSNNEIHASSNKHFIDENVIAVPCISLILAIDKIQNNIDFLKIDCEGEEFNIFKNINFIDLSKKVNYIVFEHHKFVENYDEKLKNLIDNITTGYNLLKLTDRLCFCKSKNS